MLQMVMNVIGMALFIGIYAYALSTEPPPTLDVSRPSGHARRAFARTWRSPGRPGVALDRE